MNLRYVGKASELVRLLTWLAGEKNDHGANHNRPKLLRYWLSQQELDGETAIPRIEQERN